MTHTTRLTDDEFHDTLTVCMDDITGREDEVSPDGILDLMPYLSAVPREDMEGHHLDRGRVHAVYRCSENRYDHVLFVTKTPNVFLAIVVDLQEQCVRGHQLLDLNRAYGLADPREATRSEPAAE